MHKHDKTRNWDGTKKKKQLRSFVACIIYSHAADLLAAVMFGVFMLLFLVWKCVGAWIIWTIREKGNALKQNGQYKIQTNQISIEILLRQDNKKTKFSLSSKLNRDSYSFWEVSSNETAINAVAQIHFVQLGFVNGIGQLVSYKLNVPV